VVGQEKFAISGHATCALGEELEAPEIDKNLPDYQGVVPQPTRLTRQSAGTDVRQV
jgi:hypothetical protein